jgi:hypothetical protein
MPEAPVLLYGAFGSNLLPLKQVDCSAAIHPKIVRVIKTAPALIQRKPLFKIYIKY